MKIEVNAYFYFIPAKLREHEMKEIWIIHSSEHSFEWNVSVNELYPADHI